MIELRVSGGLEADGSLAALKGLAVVHPGEHRLRVVAVSPVPAAGRRRALRLTLGPEWTFSGDEACLAALAEFGTEPPKVVIE